MADTNVDLILQTAKLAAAEFHAKYERVDSVTFIDTDGAISTMPVKDCMNLLCRNRDDMSENETEWWQSQTQKLYIHVTSDTDSYWFISSTQGKQFDVWRCSVAECDHALAQFNRIMSVCAIQAGIRGYVARKSS